MPKSPQKPKPPKSKKRPADPAQQDVYAVRGNREAGDMADKITRAPKKR